MGGVEGGWCAGGDVGVLARVEYDSSDWSNTHTHTKKNAGSKKKSAVSAPRLLDSSRGVRESQHQPRSATSVVPFVVYKGTTTRVGAYYT